MNMEAVSYLKQKLKHSTDYTLTDDDRQLLDTAGIEEYIFKKLTNKKFRKWAIDEATVQHIREAIRLNVTQNQPIQCVFPFGGYKLWRLPTSPEVDWAEFFTLAYYSSFLAPIAAAYQPGAVLTFVSDDIVVERMNNLPDADTDAYCNSFRELVNLFEKYWPDNLRIELKRVRDLYPDRQDYEQDLTKRLAEVPAEWAKLSTHERANKLKTSALNVRWGGVRDLTGLPETEKEKFIEQALMLHDAHVFVPRRKAFVRSENKIVIFANKLLLSIAIGTTKSSRTKFWTGFGVLERRGDTLLDRILSPEQLAKAKQEDHEIIATNLMPLKNFREIWLFEKPFDFYV